MFRDVTKIKQGIFERNLVPSVISELSSSEFTLNLGLFLEGSVILLNFKFSLISLSEEYFLVCSGV